MKKSPPYDRNVPYNHLPDLPISHEIIDNEVLTRWGIASRSLAELKNNLLRIPNPGMLVNTITLQEARKSNEIENIFTTDDELYSAVSERVHEDEANPSTKEVLRYREALWEGYRLNKDKGNLDVQTIEKIYQKVKDTTQGIRKPQSIVVIRRGESELCPGEIIYTPPRGEGILEEKLSNLLDFLREDPMDPLLKMVIGHYQFEAIHPFSDGNGRTGRILNLIYLVEQNLITQPVLYLSSYILQNKDEYYHLLAGVTQRNSWKPWILFMLEGVNQTARQTNQKIDAITDQMNATYNYIHPKLKWYSIELNLALFSQPYIKQELVGKITKAKSRTTITKYMKELVDLGVLSSQRKGKEVFYLNNELLRILENN